MLESKDFETTFLLDQTLEISFCTLKKHLQEDEALPLTDGSLGPVLADRWTEITILTCGNQPGVSGPSWRSGIGGAAVGFVEDVEACWLGVGLWRK